MSYKLTYSLISYSSTMSIPSITIHPIHIFFHFIYSFINPFIRPSHSTIVYSMIIHPKCFRNQFIVGKYPEGNITSDSPPRTRLPDYNSCKESTFCLFYVTAEIEGYHVTVGDGMLYNGYYNAPLEPDTMYKVFTRRVCKSNVSLY